MFKRLKKKIKNKLNNYFNSLLDPKLNEIKNKSILLNNETNNRINLINNALSNNNKSINDLNTKIDNKKEETIDDVKRLIKASIVNRETFGPYKNYCKGKKLVICGAGPSLNKYKPIPGAIHIALNRAFLFEKVHFDFIFCNDFLGIKKYESEFIKYESNKFLGDFSTNSDYNWKLPEYLFEYPKTYKYYLRYNEQELINGKIKFIKDIDMEPIGAFMMVGMNVLQIALYMNPTDIYLVGYDIQGSHFNNEKYSENELTAEKKNMDEWHKRCDKPLMNYYYDFIKFKNALYPSIKIHSINPVGLKGLFDDIYQ